MPIVLACLAVSAIGLAALYAIRWDPEVHFCKFAANLKRARAAELRLAHTNLTIVYGDSSCSFSIDGDRMLSKFNLPVVNFGMAANMGPLFLSAFTVDSVRSGDTLVVAFLPELLTDPFPPSNLAAKMGFALGHLDYINASRLTGNPVRTVADALALRPGAYYVTTYLCKVLLHVPLYRYREQDIRPSGQYTTGGHIEMRDNQDFDRWTLTPEAKSLLTKLKSWADINHVRLVYSLPWHYASEGYLLPRRRAHARLLLEVQRIMPVVKDDRLGSISDASIFADSEAHLTEAGASQRSDALANEIMSGALWSKGELERIVSRPESKGIAGSLSKAGATYAN